MISLVFLLPLLDFGNLDTVQQGRPAVIHNVAFEFLRYDTSRRTDLKLRLGSVINSVSNLLHLL